MSIALLQKQHTEIGKIAGELVNVPEEKLEAEAFEIAKKIARLAGVLTFHLQSEDKFLYPRLMKNENKQIRDIARAFTREMGDLGQKFGVFKTEYTKPQNIKSHPGKFKQDLGAVVALLNNRIEREEKELYPLLKQT